MRLALLFAVLLNCNVAWGQETNYAGLGNLLLVRLPSAPFPHSSRAQGHTYKGKFYSAADHYSDDTVAIFVPRSFRETDRIDFVVHFHGWSSNVRSVLKRHRLIEQLVSSGRNAVLVVPEGPKDAPDSSGGKLGDEGGFRRFMEDVTGALRRSGGLARTNFSVGQVILSGHSGGYKVMASIVDRGGLPESVREAWLFDGLYGEADKFVAWMDRAPGGRLLNIYTDGGGTKAETEGLMGKLKERGTAFVRLEEKDLKEGELGYRGFVFLHTDLTHNEVVEKHETFRVFLETSRLEALIERKTQNAE